MFQNSHPSKPAAQRNDLPSAISLRDGTAVCRYRPLNDPGLFKSPLRQFGVLVDLVEVFGAEGLFQTPNDRNVDFEIGVVASFEDFPLLAPCRGGLHTAFIIRLLHER